MPNIAIRVQNLSKEYHLGRAQERHDTLRDALSASFKRLRWRPSQRANEEDILWALKDVSFEVQRGEVVGIIGRNGAGKSTLLKILSQITEPTRGRAEIHGRVGSLLEVGTGFHPELTGRENIYLNGAILGMRRHEIERQFDEIVAFAEIERFLDTPVKRYSSGMYVRLAFAVAAHLEPEILLVDEVLAVGDAAFQKKCLGKMGDVAREGRTVLLVSHNMPSILSLCKRSILFVGGVKQFDGLSDSTVGAYLSASTSVARVATLDLETIPRMRAQDVMLRSLTLMDETGCHKVAFDIGETICFEIGLHSTFPVHRPNIGIGINNHLSARVATVTTHLQGIDLPSLNHELIVQCQIRGLKLVPGVYGLKLALGNGQEDLDFVEISQAFRIVEADYWGTGKVLGSAQGNIVVDAVWTVQSLIEQC